jgi:hypothetical protein
MIKNFHDNNLAYGLSNEENSYLYDPLFTMMITINGQLLLTMLLEKIANEVNIQPILINTDGFELKVLRTDIPKIMEVCSNWEKLTNLELEYLNYEKMVINDVNNYISLSEKGEIKAKGKFEWENLPYHKNKSYGIIPKALQKYFLEGIPIKQTIEEETNIFLFCRGIKAKRDSWFEYNFMNENKLHFYKLQKVNRFYISKRGGKIIKHYSDGRKSFVEAKRCQEYMYNMVKDNDSFNHLNNVNRSYYIIEANKIINEIISNQSKLF